MSDVIAMLLFLPFWVALIALVTTPVYRMIRPDPYKSFTDAYVTHFWNTLLVTVVAVFITLWSTT